MFDQEKEYLISQLENYCKQNGLPTGKLEWRAIPFSGEWGIAIPLFPLAAADTNRKGPVPEHAMKLQN